MGSLELIVMKKIFGLFSILISCSQPKNIQYYPITFFDTIQPVTIIGKIEDKLEEGKWSFILEDKTLLAEGVFLHGLRMGNWNYYLTKGHRDTIEWEIFKNPKSQFEINYPKSWKIVNDNEMNKFLFASTFETKSLHKENNYFLIGKHDIDTLGKSALEYSRESNEDITNHIEVNSFKNFIIENGSKTLYFSKYKFVREGENMFYLGLVTDLNNSILEFGYCSLNEDEEIKLIIFFNVIQGTFLDHQRIWDPFENASLSGVK